MGFRNAIVSGLTLVREAIQSVGYVPGSSGWAINRDGSAEFSDATVRGTIDAAQIDGGTITGADINGGTIDGAQITGGDLVISGGGASVHIGVDPSDGALVEFTPQEIPGQTTLPARIFTFVSGSTVTAMRLQGPKLGATVAPHIDLLMRIAEGDITLRATGAGAIELNTDNPFDSARVNRNGISLLPNAMVHRTSPVANTTSAAFVNVGTAKNFTKRFNDSRLVIQEAASCTATAIDTVAVYGVNINGADSTLTKIKVGAVGVRGTAPNGYAERTGLLAGTYSVQPRWRRDSGAGTLNMDADDQVAIMVMEVAP